MKKITFLLISSFILCFGVSYVVKAQPKTKSVNIGRAYGKIIEKETKAPVPFASIVLFVTKLGKDSIVSGGLTSENGDFSLDNLPFGSFKFKVQFIGFVPIEKMISVSMQNIEQDLGDIALTRDEKILKTVEITGTKNMDLGIDRKVFYVDKNTVSSGGTALDVMKTVPSVTLDSDGNPLLRNNSVTVYIDGRPSGLSLQQIPSDDIEKVEIITNPSAKFEAGATSGILNIVLKKNKKPGYNGLISVGAGTGNRFNSTVTFNLKEKKYAIGLTYSSNNVLNGGLLGFTNRLNYSNTLSGLGVGIRLKNNL
jgi:hypothetical protein